MSKLITAFLILFIAASILTGVMEGGGGMASAAITVAVDEDDTTFTVTSTDGFLAADYFIIGTEKVLYTGTTATTFTGCTRGHGGTDAESHAIGDIIYTADAGTVNYAFGFNVGAIADSMGAWTVITVPFYFFTRTLPRLVMWNFSFFEGDMAILAYFFFATGAGFVISMALALAGVRRV